MVKKIKVEHFEGVDFSDVFVVDGKEVVEVEQGLFKPEVNKVVEKFKEVYGLSEAVHVFFDKDEREVGRKTVK